MRKNIFEKKSLVIVSFLFINLFIMSTNIVIKDEESLFEYTIASVISPVQILVNETVSFMKSKWEKYVFMKNTYVEYIRIKKKIFDLKSKNYILKSKINYLERRLKISNLKFEKFKVVSLTNTIYIDRNFPYGNIIIDSGSIKKIEKDMILVNQNFELVGKVTASISPFTSVIRLITSKRGGVGAYIEDIGTEGFLTGSNSKICYFQYLIESKKILIGSKVYTSGTDGIFPDKIPIGKVVNIRDDYLVKKIEIKPFFIDSPINKLIVLKKI